MRVADDATDGLDERRLEVVVKQGAGLRWQILLTVGIVAAIVWPFVPATWVLAWGVAAIVVREWRARALTHMLARPSGPVSQRIRRTVLWNAAIGLVNGAAALFMLALDPTHDALLTMILVSWGAGGVSTGATIVPAFLVYGACLFVPTAAMWLLSGGWLGLGTAVLVLMFFGVQVRFARRNCETFEESYRMRQENLDLARRLSDEQAQLVAARDAADAANMAKSRFLASASHDLRQPLQALALNSGELTRCALDPAVATLASEIARSIDDLRSMLDGLLDISNLDAGSVEARARNVNLQPLLEGLGSSFRAAAMAKGLTLDWRCDPGLACCTDPDVLRRILANLIDNAIKFTPRGHILLDAAMRPDGLTLTVSDSGVGIAADDQGRIFEELVQLQNPERDRDKGYGLGLSIVRRLVVLLGIELSLQSAPGQGSTFTLRLPAASVVPVSGTSRAEAPRVLGRRVLVLDDNAGLRAAYARALGGRGCSVVAAGTLDEALALLSIARPEVAVVDYRLRDEANGLSAIASLRAASPGLAALLCSADTSPAIQDAAAAAGIRMLRKPVDEDTLMLEIDTAWQGRSSTQVDS